MRQAWCYLLVVMARPLRIEFEGAFYHITSRGNEKKAIFRGAEDFTRFLAVISRAHGRYGILVHAYVLMTNHYHLLLETPRPNLTASLHDLNTAYTNYFNRKYSRAGHLFQGRYRCILVEKDAYLLELSRYLHLNPVRAGIVQRPEDYRWSSYRSYIDTLPFPGWLRTDDILWQLSARKPEARRKYGLFVKDGLKGGIQNPLGQVIAGIALGGTTFWEETRKKIETFKQDDEIPTFKEASRRKNLEAILHAVEKFYGISREVLCQKNRPSHPATQVAMYLVRRKTDLSLIEIGACFGGRHYTAVSAAYRRVEFRRQHESKFDEKMTKVEAKLD
jgi:putative transposase